TSKYRNLVFDKRFLSLLDQEGIDVPFGDRNLSAFTSDVEAYHHLMLHIANQQKRSTQLIINDASVKRIFVDGGFSKNSIYMNLLSHVFSEMEVFASSTAQATALGTALAIHDSWNSNPLPNDLIELKFYAASKRKIV